MSIPTEIISGIDQLEPLPRTARELMLAAMNEDVSFEELAAIVERDEAITANLLRKVNSSAGGSCRQIDNVHQAVVRTGLSGLTQIVIGNHVQQMTSDAPMYDLTEDEMWRHSVVASLAAQAIRSNASIDVPPAAITAALVHDIGKLLMVRYLQGDVDALLGICEEEQVTWIEAERRMFGCDHAEVGGEVAAAWNFPEAIREAIVRHHESQIVDSTPTIDTVVAANFICRTIGIGLGAAGMNLNVDEAVLERLGLGYETFCLICAETAQAAAEI